MNINSESSILDVATGTGDVAFEIAERYNANIIGLDYAEGMITVAKKKALQKKISGKITFIQGDGENLPFEDNSYDVIFCNHVLEHIPDDDKAMEELYRILKPNGMAILQIPQDLNREKTFEDNSITDSKERARIFGQYDHVRIYGRDYFEKLRSKGFIVKEVDYTHQLSKTEVDKYRLAKGEILPICFKSNN